MDLDGIAISIGDSVCRFFARNGHMELNSLICSDGYYSAGWKIFGVAVILGFMAFFFTRMLRPS